MKFLKITLVALCLALSTAATAAPLASQKIANMIAQNDLVMDKHLCAVANDTSDHGSEVIKVIVGGGLRSILVNDYNWIRSAGYAPGVKHKYLMDDRIDEACSADGMGGRCMAARSLWQQYAPIAAQAASYGK